MTPPRIFKRFLDFANGGAPLAPGIVRDIAKRPVLRIGLLSVRRDIAESRSAAVMLLAEVARNGPVAAEDAISNRGGVPFVPFTLHKGNDVVVWVPTARVPNELAYAVLAAARNVRLNRRECLLNRLARCEECRRFFFTKTRKKSRFCKLVCRWQFWNRMRARVSRS